MAREVVIFQTEERMDRPTLAAFLHQLADKVAGGVVTLRAGADELTLTLPAMLTLEIKVDEEQKRSGLKRALEIEIAWRDGDAGASGGSALA